MAKEQRHIAIFQDENGQTVDFHRFTYKRFKTVMRKLTEYYAENETLALIWQDVEKATTLKIEETNSYGESTGLYWKFAINEFIQAVRLCQGEQYQLANTEDEKVKALTNIFMHWMLVNAKNTSAFMDFVDKGNRYKKTLVELVAHVNSIVNFHGLNFWEVWGEEMKLPYFENVKKQHNKN